MSIYPNLVAENLRCSQKYSIAKPNSELKVSAYHGRSINVIFSDVMRKGELIGLITAVVAVAFSSYIIAVCGGIIALTSRAGYYKIQKYAPREERISDACHQALIERMLLETQYV